MAHLEDRTVIAVAGPEARPFLQGLITNDIERLVPGTGLYAALLTPQGKILFDFFLVEGDGAILIDCAVTALDTLLRRLTMYKLRARVTLEARGQLAVLAGWNTTPPAGAIAYSDPRLAVLGWRAIIAKAELPNGAVTQLHYHAHRLDQGVPEASNFGSDKIFALDAGLDELHGVDFAKGCYVGQELTARMKHRGAARKRLILVRGNGATSGASVTAGGKDIGEIVDGDGGIGFALVRLDRLQEAGGSAVNAGSSNAVLDKPTWLFT